MKENIIRRYSFCLLASLVLCVLNTAEASSTVLKQGIMIVAYNGIAWYPYILDTSDKKDQWIKVKEIEDPSGVTWQPKTADFFIKGNDRKLYSFNVEKQILSPLKAFSTQVEKSNSYTQLRAYEHGLVMIRLIDGKSRDTEIIGIDQQSNVSTLLKQASAQFHPYRYKNFLYYAHVSCRMECSPLIQEIWRKDLISGKTEQLSLLNAVSYLHSIDNAGEQGFLSSNKSGFYHIARLDFKTHKVKWLTQGQVTDSFPSITDNGDLYFIRHSIKGSVLMMLKSQFINSNKKITEASFSQISLPENVQKVRYLESLN